MTVLQFIWTPNDFGSLLLSSRIVLLNGSIEKPKVFKVSHESKTDSFVKYNTNDFL